MRDAGLRRALAAAPWAALDVVATALYGLLFLLVVGLFVGPAELGLASSALAFVLLAEALSGAGLSDAVVRLPSADTRATDAAHALCLALSLAAMPVIWGAAWLYGHGVGEPRLLALAVFASVMLPLNAAAMVPTALLVRKMRGRQLMLRPVAGKLLAIAALLGAAACGGRASAVIAGSVAGSLGGTAALWLAVTRRPRLRWNRAAAAAHLRFGLFSGTDSLFWMIGLRLFTLGFAGAFGMRALGLLQLAMRLVEEVSRLLQSIVMRYALALFAHMHRGGGRGAARTAHALLAATRMMNALAVPALIGIACTGDRFVAALFGARWAASGLYVQLLGAATLLSFARLLVTPALKAIGRPRLVAAAAAANFATALAVVAALPFVAAPVAVALWAARELPALALWFALARRALGIGYRSLARALLPSWTAGGAMGAVLLVLRPLLGHAPGDLALFAGAGIIAYAAVWWGWERAPVAAFLRGPEGGRRWRRSMS